MIKEREILNASILIVDDQEPNVNMLTQILEELGYTNVSSTMNPLEVCSLNQQHHYDLILLDLQMPKMDGFEVMANLNADQRNDPQDDYLPVLVITAQPNHKQRALDAGAKDFVSKPFDLLEVKIRIRNMLEVRLLYKKLKNYSIDLEQTVAMRTAELSDSEARYRSLTELMSDWYWEQDEHGNFTKVSGPVMEMLGLSAAPNDGNTPVLTNSIATSLNDVNMSAAGGWNDDERDRLRAAIAARQPFLDFVLNRPNHDGTLRKFQVSGEPVFNQACRFIGYRGIGVEINAGK